MSKVRLLVLPIFRRFWLFHAHVTNTKPSPQGAPANWRTGHDLEEKLNLLGESLKHKFRQRLLRAWGDLEKAKDGTFQNRIYRLAQGVLSREDPQEVSLREIPSEIDVEGMEIIYPPGLPERLVRRRLRLMIRERTRKHRMSLVGWSLGCLPLLPLLATPVPNIPVYYAGYRVYSHYSAWIGVNTLQAGLHNADARSKRTLLTQIEQWRQDGIQFSEDSWALRILREDKRYLDLLERESSRWTPKTRRWQPVFVKSEELGKYTCPEKRKEVPLDDNAAIGIAKCFSVPDLIRNVARARKRAVGGMFPINLN